MLPNEIKEIVKMSQDEEAEGILEKRFYSVEFCCLPKESKVFESEEEARVYCNQLIEMYQQNYEEELATGCLSIFEIKQTHVSRPVVSISSKKFINIVKFIMVRSKMSTVHLDNPFEFSQKSQRAKENYICQWCGETISENEEYIKRTYYHKKSFRTVKLHKECANAIGIRQDWIPMVQIRGVRPKMRFMDKLDLILDLLLHY